MEKIALMCFSTARSVRNSAAAIPALFFPIATCCSTSRSRGVSCAIGESLHGTPGCDQHLDDARVDHRTASRHLANGADQLVDVGHALFQQIGATACALLEQRERVLGLRVLAQDDDAHVGPLRPQALRGAKALVGAGRWHADVRDDHRGVVLLDRALETREGRRSSPATRSRRRSRAAAGCLRGAGSCPRRGPHGSARHENRRATPGPGACLTTTCGASTLAAAPRIGIPLESWEKSR